MIELDAWGYDYDLMSAQYEPWTNGVLKIAEKRKYKKKNINWETKIKIKKNTTKVDSL